MFKIKNLFTSLKATILSCSVLSMMIICSHTAFCHASPAFEGKEVILQEKPTAKSVVGTVFLYFYNKEAYILLAQDKKSGTFSGFGGGTGSDQTFAQATISQLGRKMGGIFKLTTLDLERDAYIAHKKKGARDVVYSVYPVSKEQFELSKGLKQNDFNNLFVWLPVKDLLTKSSAEFEVKDINNTAQKIKLRPSFVDNCLSNPDFAEIISYLSSKQQN
jgi:hypothetical protein